MLDERASDPGLPPPAPARGHRIWMAALAAFVLGLGAAGWLGWRSGADFTQVLGLSHGGMGFSAHRDEHPAAPRPATAGTSLAPDAIALSGRVAALEQRLDRIDQRMVAGASNTSRAEALLVAFAVRRVAERGAPLGYLADQLKLRFGDAQPNAVATIIADTGDLVPLDRLAAQLETLAPRSTANSPPSMWGRIAHELSELFVIRRDRPALTGADGQLDAARNALSEGRIDDAVTSVQHIADGSDTARWTAAARRYRDVQRALDLIDATALLEPRPLPGTAAGPVGAIE